MTTATAEPETWKFPADVSGWLTPAEGAALRDLARDKYVLEIGSYHGLSTICMASVADRVYAIDWHRGDEACGWADSESAFRANLERYGVTDEVEVLVGCTGEMIPRVPEGLDLAFVDGAHDEASVRADLAAALSRVRYGGTIAMHDVDYPTVIGPARELLGEPLKVVDRLGIWEVGKRIEAPERHAFIAFPMRPGEVQRRKEENAGRIAFQTPSRGRATVTVSGKESSDYCRNFNGLWADAHNDPRPFSHFAMQHDDVLPAPGWFDVLADEMDRHGADVVSAVIPLKDARGLTTTAVRDPRTGRIRRLTMREVFALPETFGIEEVSAAGIKLGRDDTLLVNTGLWAVRFDRNRERLRKFPGFNTTHTIGQSPDGKLVCVELTEDWDWSEWARRAGLKVMATRKVLVAHQGDWANDPATGVKLLHPETGRPYRVEWRNDEAWGEWETDLGDPAWQPERGKP